MRRVLFAFVLSAPCLACPGDDTRGETGAMTVASSFGTGTATTTTMNSSSSSSGEPDASTGTSSVTSTTSSEPPSGSSSGGGTSPLDACRATCERLNECGIERVPNCGIPCVDAESDAGGCESEYVAQQTCVTALVCDELQAWVDAMLAPPDDYPCAAEDDAFQTCATDGA
jgi:hypothetical protein